MKLPIKSIFMNIVYKNNYVMTYYYYLMTSELQIGFIARSSTIMCSILLVETVQYYVSSMCMPQFPLMLFLRIKSSYK